MKKGLDAISARCIIDSKEVREGKDRNGNPKTYYNFTIVGYGCSGDLNVTPDIFNNFSEGQEIILSVLLDFGFPSTWRLSGIKSAPEKKDK